MLLRLSSSREEILGVRSFIWEKPSEFTFYPGQYLDYKLPVVDPDGDTRAFTISASPTEESLMLTTREGHSIFKQKLFTLQPGEIIESSHPAGTFIFDETSTAVFIAGGIGITPFRSMIKYAVDKSLTTPIILFYANSDDNFVFKDSLNQWQASLPNLKIIYLNSTTDGLLSITHIKKEIQNLLEPIFYLAGPPKMVINFERILLAAGIDKTNIRYDKFDGYK